MDAWMDGWMDGWMHFFSPEVVWCLRWPFWPQGAPRSSQKKSTSMQGSSMLFVSSSPCSCGLFVLWSLVLLGCGENRSFLGAGGDMVLRESEAGSVVPKGGWVSWPVFVAVGAWLPGS